MPENLAVINRSMSFYIARDVPTGEIDQIIGWLDSIRKDCGYKISQLESLKGSRARAEKHRNSMNAIARQFCDPDSAHLDLETRTEIIQQRLGCDPKRARDVAENVTRKIKKQLKQERNRQIFLEYATGVKSGALAKKYGISRQQVHNIVEKHENSRYFK